MNHKPAKLLDFSCVALLNDLFVALQKNRFVLLPLLLFVSCTNDTANKESASGKDEFFYPVNDFFKQQIESVGASDNISYLRAENGVTTDSSVISKEQFNKLAYHFIEHDIADSALKIYYKQSVFMDETTASITFSYTSTDKALPIQSVDVLVDTLRQEVKRIFISSQLIKGQDTTLEKLGWKNGESFFISNIKNPQNGKNENSFILVKWKSVNK